MKYEKLFDLKNRLPEQSHDIYDFKIHSFHFGDSTKNALNTLYPHSKQFNIASEPNESKSNLGIISNSVMPIGFDFKLEPENDTTSTNLFVTNGSRFHIKQKEQPATYEYNLKNKSTNDMILSAMDKETAYNEFREMLIEEETQNTEVLDNETESKDRSGQDIALRRQGFYEKKLDDVDINSPEYENINNKIGKLAQKAEDIENKIIISKAPRRRAQATANVDKQLDVLNEASNELDKDKIKSSDYVDYIPETIQNQLDLIIKYRQENEEIKKLSEYNPSDKIPSKQVSYINELLHNYKLPKISKTAQMKDLEKGARVDRKLQQLESKMKDKLHYLEPPPPFIEETKPKKEKKSKKKSSQPLFIEGQEEEKGDESPKPKKEKSQKKYLIDDDDTTVDNYDTVKDEILSIFENRTNDETRERDLKELSLHIGNNTELKLKFLEYLQTKLLPATPSDKVSTKEKNIIKTIFLTNFNAKKLHGIGNKEKLADFIKTLRNDLTADKPMDRYVTKPPIHLSTQESDDEDDIISKLTA